MRTIIAVVSILASGYALADKYGIDESLGEGGSSWGALGVTVLVLAYVYFKGK